MKTIATLVLALGVLLSGGGVLRYWVLAGGQAEVPSEGEALQIPQKEKPIPAPEDASTRGKPLLLRHDRPVSGAAFSPDGKTVTTATNRIHFWDVATGKERSRIEDPEGYGPWAFISQVAFSPDGKTLASIHVQTGNFGFGRMAEAVVFLWEVTPKGEVRNAKPIKDEGGKREIRFPAPPNVVFSGDGKTLAGGWSTGVFFWDTATGKQRAHLRVLPDSEAENDTVQRIVLSDQGKLLVAVTSQGMIHRWDPATGRKKDPLKEPPGFLAKDESSSFGAPTFFGPSFFLTTPMTLSSQGKILAWRKTGNTISLKDTATGKELQRLASPGLVYSMAFSPDGKALAVGRSETMRFWDVATGKRLGLIGLHDGPIRAVAFSPDGKLVASASEDKTVLVQELAPAPPEKPKP